MTFYKFVTGFVALGIAACAAFFSVIGIATFLGGNFFEVALMAGFLEAGKLICASAAYRFRKVAARWVQVLLVTFTIVMMFITSTGIFGFLSESYQKAASERDISEQQIENVRAKKQSLETRVERLEEDREQVVSTQERLQQLQAEQGWLSERQDQRLSAIPNELSTIDSSLTATRDSILSLNQEVTELEASQGEEAKLGPIMFVADTVGLDPDRAALYFILLLIFVFDPMAVTLVVALSMATGGFEETVTEEEKSVEVPTNPAGKTVDVGKIREELDKPLSDTDDEPQSEPETDDQEEVKETPDDEAQSRIDRMNRFASLDTDLSSEVEDVVEIPKTSRNNEDDESVEDTPESDSDGDYQEWLNRATSEEASPKEKPWKNPFKRPFGNPNQ